MVHVTGDTSQYTVYVDVSVWNKCKSMDTPWYMSLRIILDIQFMLMYQYGTSVSQWTPHGTCHWGYF